MPNLLRRRNTRSTQSQNLIYITQDVEATLKLFSEHQFRVPVQLTKDVSVTFFPSGHILDSSFIVLEAAGKTILFTSDLGRDNHPLLSIPDKPPASGINVVVTEPTYGDRVHDTSAKSFANEINAGLARGGTVLIPAFAIDRTEVILMALRALIKEKKIPPVPIFVDSPMAIAALELYRRAVDENSTEIRPEVSQKWINQDPFDAGALEQLATNEESKSIKDWHGSGILISASGMGSS